MASTTTPVTSEELLVLIDAGWRPFRDAIGAMPVGRLEERTPAGWTVKQMLAHAAAWEETVPSRLASVRSGAGDPPLYEDIDAFNAVAAAQAGAVPAAEVMRRLDSAHAQLVEAVRGLPEGILEPLIVDIVQWNTYGHYPDHNGELSPAQPVGLEAERGLDGW